MTGQEHYRAAEELIAKADSMDTGDPLDDREVAMYWASVAQVHATLALAAAASENGDIDDPYGVTS